MYNVSDTMIIINIPNIRIIHIDCIVLAKILWWIKVSNFWRLGPRHHTFRGPVRGPVDFGQLKGGEDRPEACYEVKILQYYIV